MLPHRLGAAACHGETSTVIRWIADGGNVDARCAENSLSTLLHAAAGGGQAELTVMLIQRSCDVNARDENGCTPLLVAALMGHTAVVIELLKAGASEHLRAGGRTPLLVASAEGHTEVVRVLLNSRSACTSESAEAFATDCGHAAVARVLRQHALLLRQHANGSQLDAAEAAKEARLQEVTQELEAELCISEVELHADDGAGPVCAACGRSLPRKSFSKNQLSKRLAARCKECVDTRQPELADLSASAPCPPSTSSALASAGRQTDLFQPARALLRAAQEAERRGDDAEAVRLAYAAFQHSQTRGEDPAMPPHRRKHYALTESESESAWRLLTSAMSSLGPTLAATLQSTNYDLGLEGDGPNACRDRFLPDGAPLTPAVYAANMAANAPYMSRIAQSLNAQLAEVAETVAEAMTPQGVLRPQPEERADVLARIWYEMSRG